MCKTCGFPERTLWTFHNCPKLPDVAVGNWMALKQCPDCRAYWCEVPHEPYAAFTFLTFWPYDADAWQRVHSLDNGNALHEWHDAVLREQWQSLTDDEQEAIQRWRDRTYCHYNPIDRGPDVPKPVTIKTASDLAIVVKQCRTSSLS
jgi:hypothetical protein